MIVVREETKTMTRLQIKERLREIESLVRMGAQQRSKVSDLTGEECRVKYFELKEALANGDYAASKGNETDDASRGCEATPEVRDAMASRYKDQFKTKPEVADMFLERLCYLSRYGGDNVKCAIFMDAYGDDFSVTFTRTGEDVPFMFGGLICSGGGTQWGVHT
jgi:hypothetical protein